MYVLLFWWCSSQYINCGRLSTNEASNNKSLRQDPADKEANMYRIFLVIFPYFIFKWGRSSIRAINNSTCYIHTMRYSILIIMLNVPSMSGIMLVVRTRSEQGSAMILTNDNR